MEAILIVFIGLEFLKHVCKKYFNTKSTKIYNVKEAFT